VSGSPLKKIATERRENKEEEGRSNGNKKCTSLTCLGPY
jgi:hypothetical protein